jgi:RimJ/RimL family protein N-acetyltransferase
VAEIPFPNPPLSDGTVALRPWEPGDAPAIAAWGADPEILRWSGVPAGYTESAALDYHRRMEDARAEGRAIAFAIIDRAPGSVIGSCDLRRPDPEDPALGEIGYLLSANARGRGYATRAIGLLVGWAFDALGIDRVQALAHPDNPRSQAVLERLGFRREGLLRGYRSGGGGREDRLMFALLRGEQARATSAQRLTT